MSQGAEGFGMRFAYADWPRFPTSLKLDLIVRPGRSWQNYTRLASLEAMGAVCKPAGGCKEADFHDGEFLVVTALPSNKRIDPGENAD